MSKCHPYAVHIYCYSYLLHEGKNFFSKDVDIKEDKKDIIKNLIYATIFSSFSNVVENAISQLYSYATKLEYSELKDKLIFFACHAINGEIPYYILFTGGIQLPVFASSWKISSSRKRD